MKEFHFPVRVYFSDTDAEGIVYHTRYLDFAEHARTEMLREALPDFSQNDMMEKGTAFVVRSIGIEYRKPGILDDLLDVVSTVEASGHFSAVFHQEVMRDGETLASVTVRVASISTATKRPSPLPKEILEALV